MQSGKGKEKHLPHFERISPPETGRDLGCKLGKQNMLLNRKLKFPTISVEDGKML